MFTVPWSTKYTPASDILTLTRETNMKAVAAFFIAEVVWLDGLLLSA